MFDVTKLKTKQEDEMLAKLKSLSGSLKSSDRLFIVLNKIDQVKKQERDGVKNAVHELLRNTFGSPVPHKNIFGLSARDALLGRLARLGKLPKHGNEIVQGDRDLFLQAVYGETYEEDEINKR